MAVTNKSSIKGLQTPHGTPAGASKGLKRPSPELKELLRLVNLVPADVELPEMKLKSSLIDQIESPDLGLIDEIESMPDRIRLEVLEHSEQPERWQIPAEARQSTPHLQELWRCVEALNHYEQIRVGRENLRRLIDGSTEPLQINARWRRSPKGRLLLEPIEFDWAVKALLSAEVDYLARCAYSKCGAFFYRVRRGQPGCTPEHSEIVRKQRKRDRDNDALRLQAEGKVKPRKARKRGKNGRTNNQTRHK